MSGIDTAAVRWRYAAGESMREIAADLGCAVSTVQRRVPGRRPVGRPPRADVDTAAIVAMHDDEGMTFAEIGKRLGIATSTASRRYGDR